MNAPREDHHDPVVCVEVRCHYRHDSADACARRACPFASQRQGAEDRARRAEAEQSKAGSGSCA
jgi:hypothetical protein